VERGIARRDAVAIVVNEAKTRIANQLARRSEQEPEPNQVKDDFWFDPYVGLRTRYNFNKTYYTGVRGEIGGFGVGADLMWEVEAVVGINLTRSIFTEIGYRALGGNFEENNFRFDTVMHGPQITNRNHLLKHSLGMRVCIGSVKASANRWRRWFLTTSPGGSIVDVDRTRDNG